MCSSLRARACTDTGAGDTVVLPLPPSHNPANLGTAVRTSKKLPGTPNTHLLNKIFVLCQLKFLIHTSFEEIRNVVVKPYDPFFFSPCLAYHQYRYVSTDFL